MKIPLPHADMTHFSSKDHEVCVGGMPLGQIAALLGQTPFYAYDRQLIADKVHCLKQQLPKTITLHYAIKANPLPCLVHFMASQVAGFDVASKKEMLLAMQSGMPCSQISFAGPGKTVDDIRAAIIAGVTLHVESLTEISRAVTIGQAMKIKPNIAIRINPAFELKASGMKMSGGSKPFGIDEEQIEDILQHLDYGKVRLRGFHIFAGSQNLNTAAIVEMHQNVFKLADKLTQQSPVKLDYINIGGGLGIPYFPGEKRLDLAPISDNLQQLLARYQSSLEGIDIIMELGRYLVAEAGIYVVKIIDKKQSRGTNYLVCDGGLHHHLANSGNFGQVIRKNYPVAIGNKLNDEQLEQVNIVGPLCTPLDIIAEKVTLAKANIDDLVVVYQSGAYGASASPKDFLSQPDLAEILL